MLLFLTMIRSGFFLHFELQSHFILSSTNCRCTVYINHPLNEGQIGNSTMDLVRVTCATLYENWEHRTQQGDEVADLFGQLIYISFSRRDA